MKKLLFTLTLMVSVTSAFAQKVYVNLIAKNLDSSSPYVYLSGAIPSSINVSTYNNPGIGQTLNLLAKEGFVVEQCQWATTMKQYYYRKTPQIHLVGFKELTQMRM